VAVELVRLVLLHLVELPEQVVLELHLPLLDHQFITLVAVGHWVTTHLVVLVAQVAVVLEQVIPVALPQRVQSIQVAAVAVGHLLERQADQA
jgi:hypothetical protein